MLATLAVSGGPPETHISGAKARGWPRSLPENTEFLMHPPASRHAVPLASHGRALETLVRAFITDPMFTFVFQRLERREHDLRRLFTGSLRHAALVGGVSNVDEGLGVALWTPRDSMRVSFSDAWRAGMVTLPFTIGPSAFRRLDRLEHELDGLTRAAAGSDFGYVWMLGVHPDAWGRGLGRAALERALTSMRERGFTRCVLRTQQPRNISLYRHLGFHELARHTPEWVPLETVIFGRDL
jgi:ribosomal protein S18 acetylase RimI-like enzyme